MMGVYLGGRLGVMGVYLGGSHSERRRRRRSLLPAYQRHLERQAQVTVA